MSSSKSIKALKPAVISKHQIHTKDSGSVEVQVAILTEEIKKLTEHLKINKKDHSSRRGLLRKVGKRKKLLNYLLGEDRSRYIRTCKKNGIRLNMISAIVVKEVVEDDVEVSETTEVS
jgi:small subunit ribosomal protein S15